MIKDEIAACKMCVALWMKLMMVKEYQKDIVLDKHKACLSLGEKWLGLENECPCCQFTKDHNPDTDSRGRIFLNCTVCPMGGFFSKCGGFDEPIIDSRVSGRYSFSCENTDSPYQKWLKAEDLLDKKIYAGKMVQLACDAQEYWTAMRDMNITC